MATKNMYSEDEVILGEGKDNSFIYLIEYGNVILYMNYQKEDEYVIGVCGPNKTFGEVSALTGEKAEYTAVAYCKAHIVRFSVSELDHFLQSYPNQAINMIRSISRYNKLLSINCRQLLVESNNYAMALSMQKDLNKYSKNEESEEIIKKYKSWDDIKDYIYDESPKE